MTIVQILTCSGWAVSGSNRLLDLLQFDAHVVDVRVDSDQVHVTVLLWPRLHCCQDVVQDAQHAQIDRSLLREVQQDHVRSAGGLRVWQAGERCLRQQVQLVIKIWRNIPNWPRTWKTERTKDSKPLSSEVSQGAGVFERESEKTEQRNAGATLP